MITTTTVKANELLAVALFVEKKPAIEQFGGVNVDVANGTIRLVASDRSNLATMKIDDNPTYRGRNIRFTIPSAMIKNIKKTNSRNDNPVAIRFDSADGLITLIQSDQKFIGSSIKGTFVDWRHLIPEPFKPVFDIYKLTSLTVFEKAAVLLKSTALFYHNYDAIGVVHIPVFDQETKKERLFIGLVQKTKQVHEGILKPMEESYYD